LDALEETLLEDFPHREPKDSVYVSTVTCEIIEEVPGITISASVDIGGHIPTDCVAGQTTHSTSAPSPGPQADENNVTIETTTRSIQSDADNVSLEPEFANMEEIGEYRISNAHAKYQLSR
jgi:hypothetical protein